MNQGQLKPKRHRRMLLGARSASTPSPNILASRKSCCPSFPRFTAVAAAAAVQARLKLVKAQNVKLHDAALQGANAVKIYILLLSDESNSIVMRV